MKQSFERRAAKVLFGVAAACVLLELGLRLAGVLYLDLRNAEALPSAPGTVSIMCLGESTTHGLWVPYEDSYPEQLGRLLRQRYPNAKIDMIVPPHTGENSSQVVNRMEKYLTKYHPALVVMMMGINNEWSLRESNISQFLEVDDFQAAAIEFRIFLDRSRLFKVLRHVYLSVVNFGTEEYVPGWGEVEYSTYPPRSWIASFAERNRRAFVLLWRHDIRSVIRAAKAHGVKVILMTYHRGPGYISNQEFVRMAKSERIPLIRNDRVWAPLYEDGSFQKYVLAQDHWHPNKEGYSLIANEVFRFIVDQDYLDLNLANGVARPLSEREGNSPVPLINAH